MSITITTLIENSKEENSILHQEHGLSFLIEGENFNILYDTGQTNKFIDNAKKLNIDLSKVNHVVMSHSHYDHTGGFKDFVLNTKASFHLYIGNYFFNQKYSFKENTYTYLGPNFDASFLVEKNIHTNYIKTPTKIAPNIILSTNFNRKTSFETPNPRFYIKEDENYILDDFQDEIVLCIQSKYGLIVLLGCSHPGVVNILETLMKQTGQPIYAVIGGTHLVEANEARLDATLDYFEKIGIKHIGVSHCTGDLAIQKIKKRFNSYFKNITGTRIIIDNGLFLFSS